MNFSKKNHELHKTNKIIVSKIFKPIAILAVVLLVSAFTANKIISDEKGYDIGDIATDFKLENIDGNKVSMSDYKDAKGFIITFTCNTCPYAVLYEDRLEALNKKYAPEGYPVIAIMPNNTDIMPGDNMEAMKTRAKEKGFTFPYLLDQEQNIFPQYGAAKTPHMYVLQKTSEGNIVKYIGAIDDNYKDADLVNTKYVENAVDALLKGEEVTETKTRAIGCTIKV
ncbi:MAG: thioredoxin family protein [Bacteroidetes bacterium]|nr:MAG: thioredoxin family protein [Bacteroidota bacterium]